jgi:hypothetical protein
MLLVDDVQIPSLSRSGLKICAAENPMSLGNSVEDEPTKTKSIIADSRWRGVLEASSIIEV